MPGDHRPLVSFLVDLCYRPSCNHGKREREREEGGGPAALRSHEHLRAAYRALCPTSHGLWASKAVFAILQRPRLELQLDLFVIAILCLHGVWTQGNERLASDVGISNRIAIGGGLGFRNNAKLRHLNNVGREALLIQGDVALVGNPMLESAVALSAETFRAPRGKTTTVAGVRLQHRPCRCNLSRHGAACSLAAHCMPGRAAMRAGACRGCANALAARAAAHMLCFDVGRSVLSI